MQYIGSGIIWTLNYWIWNNNCLRTQFKWKQLYCLNLGGEKREAWVGFLVDDRATKNVLAFQPISNRPCCTNRSWHHPSTHFSRLHTNWNKPRLGQRWLLRQIATIQRTELTILAGDINVHIGTNRDSWQETMGKFGVGKINDNGLCLLSFTGPRPSLSLVIASSNIVACVPGWPAQRGRWGCGI